LLTRNGIADITRGTSGTYSAIERQDTMPINVLTSLMGSSHSMTAEQTDALVLRLYAWSESSCVASLFTRDFGKQAVLAKGAWRPRSPFEGALDLLAICRVVFLPKAGDALGVLTEAKLVQRYRMGRHDLLRLYCGYYVSELLDRFTEKGEPQPEVFDLAAATLHALGDESQEPRACILRWELQLLRLMGHAPTWDRCAQCGKLLDWDRMAPFAPLAGGVVCDACGGGVRPLIQMPAYVRRELQRFSEPNWHEIPTSSLIENGRAAVRGALERYIAALLDRKLNLTYFLQELGH
jgi:DNA repair protein RecO (recombination protein O)